MAIRVYAETKAHHFKRPFKDGTTKMIRSKIQQVVTEQLSRSGIRVGTDHPWDIQVHDPRFYQRLAMQGSLGAGESYVEGWWDCQRIDLLAERVLQSGLANQWGRNLRAGMGSILRRLINPQRGKRSEKVALLHYNIDPAFFEMLLGPTMNYSCAYWRSSRSLDDAQRQKMHLIGKKLDLGPQDRALDIGCGWGGLAHYLSSVFGCSVVGITNSTSQARYANERFGSHLCTFIHCDYKAFDPRAHGGFTKVVSVGMFEHVGIRNYQAFFGLCRRAIPSDGLILLHTFGRTIERDFDPWTDRYIFPNSYLPTIQDIGRATGGSLVMEDWHNFGADYDRTLMAWLSRFEAWASSGACDMSIQQVRMWRYYLATYAACFRVRNRIQLWQLVLSRRGVAGGYRSIREIAETRPSYRPRKQLALTGD